MRCLRLNFLTLVNECRDQTLSLIQQSSYRQFTVNGNFMADSSRTVILKYLPRQDLESLTFRLRVRHMCINTTRLLAIPHPKPVLAVLNEILVCTYFAHERQQYGPFLVWLQLLSCDLNTSSDYWSYEKVAISCNRFCLHHIKHYKEHVGLYNKRLGDRKTKQHVTSITVFSAYYLT